MWSFERPVLGFIFRGLFNSCNTVCWLSVRAAATEGGCVEKELLALSGVRSGIDKRSIEKKCHF